MPDSGACLYVQDPEICMTQKLGTRWKTFLLVGIALAVGGAVAEDKKAMTKSLFALLIPSAISIPVKLRLKKGSSFVFMFAATQTIPSCFRSIATRLLANAPRR